MQRNVRVSRLEWGNRPGKMQSYTTRVAVTKEIIVLTIHSDRCIPTRTEARPFVHNQVKINPYWVLNQSLINYCIIMEKLIIMVQGERCSQILCPARLIAIDGIMWRSQSYLAEILKDYRAQQHSAFLQLTWIGIGIIY